MIAIKIHEHEWVTMRIYKHLKALNNPFNLKNILSHLSKEYVLQDWAIQLHNLVITTYVNIIFR